ANVVDPNALVVGNIFTNNRTLNAHGDIASGTGIFVGRGTVLDNIVSGSFVGITSVGEIARNLVFGNASVGIQATNVHDNVIQNNAVGFVNAFANVANVHNNLFLGNTIGAWADSLNLHSFISNTFYANDTALRVDTPQVTVRNNIIVALSGVGIAVS